MGIYLNPDNAMFQKSVNSEIYVDKTILIGFTNKNINTQTQNICVSRPRRFGKSMAADMLVAYYSKGCNSKELFDKFEIAKTDNYEKYLNKFNVIRIDIQTFTDKYEDIKEMIKTLTKVIMFELKMEFPKVAFFDENDLARALDDIYIQTKEQFIFIIDEWDSVIRNHVNNDKIKKQYLNFIRDLLKGKSYVALAYMTGILPIRKYGQHSVLNMFQEFSIVNAKPITEFTGFTENETEILCNKYNMPYNDMKEWYDGYNVNGMSIYNPNSVVEACVRQQIDNYWTKTESYEALTTYIQREKYGIRNIIVDLLAGKKQDVDITTFENDMEHLHSADDVLTLLIHLGYLTYDFETKKCYIPNGEVWQQFASTIRISNWGNVSKALQQSDDLLDATLECDEEKSS